MLRHTPSAARHIFIAFKLIAEDPGYEQYKNHADHLCVSVTIFFFQFE